MAHTRPISFLLAAVVSLAAAAEVNAQAADAYATTDSVTVGDRFGLVVAAGHDGSRASVFPHEFLPDSLSGGAVFALGDFEILDIRASGSRPFGGGGVIDSVIYEATTFALDTARVAGIPVRLAGPADTLSLTAGPVILPVTSLVPADAEDIRDLKPLAEFPRPWWPWVVGLMALAAVAAALWIIRRRRLDEEEDPEEVEPPVPPYEQAMQRLHELERVDVDSDENVKPYYVEISDVLRTYFGRRVRVKALESTTRELLESLEERSVGSGVPESVVEEARRILDQADLVKFADDRPVWETSRRVMTLTKSTIETTERALRSREQALRQHAESSAPSSGHTTGPSSGAADPGRPQSRGDGESSTIRPIVEEGAPPAAPEPDTGGSEGGFEGGFKGGSRPSDPYAPPESR